MQSNEFCCRLPTIKIYLKFNLTRKKKQKQRTFKKKERKAEEEEKRRTYKGLQKHRGDDSIVTGVAFVIITIAFCSSQTR